MSSRRIFSFNHSNHTCCLSLRFHDDPPSYRESSQQYPQPYRDELFAACLKIPMSAGCLISLAGISKYNEHRKQAFECWCGLLSPETPTVQNPTHGYLGCSKGTCQRSTVGYSISNPKNLLTPPASIQTNQHYSSQVEGSRAPLSSPPALTDLLVSIGRRGKGPSPTHFLSLVSPSLSVASGLISGPNGSSTSQSSGSSRNDSEKLEFCDCCFVAYPLEEFKTHTCHG
ncbi:hypothetical protein K439DRAFT_1642276 [Ramaria rubella]|nr:hypothetical protein K439DRAFT_1642276 [Ramaria rubella]